MGRRISMILERYRSFSEEFKIVCILTIPSILLLVSFLNIIFCTILSSYFSIINQLIEEFQNLIGIYILILFAFDLIFVLITFFLWISFFTKKERVYCFFILIIQFLPIFIVLCPLVLMLFGINKNLEI
jgi:hypothetical protein